jgi:hypothetical protein
MSSTFTMSDVAHHFGITRSQAYREVQSWPHDRHGATITFTPGHMTEINRLMNAGPDAQLARLALIETKRAALQAQDAA